VVGKNKATTLSTALDEELDTVWYPCPKISSEAKMCVPINFILDNFPEASGLQHLRDNI
jgi:hypothetical protein